MARPHSPVTVRLRQLSFVLAFAFLAAHALRVPQTLEDIDSINFAMGVERFDVADHRPHPPGYPVFIALAKLSTAVTSLGSALDRDAAAAAGLAALSVIAGALSIPVFSAFWLALGLSPIGALVAAVIAASAPLFWLTASRPLSDTPGLVAAVAVQTLLLRGVALVRRDEARLSRLVLVAAAAAGFAIGLRSQTFWLTGPLAAWLLGTLLWHRRVGHALQFLVAAATGALLWAVPLVWATGGLSAYLRALRAQGQEDFGGVQMLATTPSWSLFELAMARTFIDPWQVKSLAHVVLVLALVGLGVLAWRRRLLLGLMAIAFLPYLALHLAFQETITARYALPMLVPVAGLAVVSLETMGPRLLAACGTLIAMVSLFFSVPALDLYVRNGAPVFQALRDMHSAWSQAPEPPVLKMHHQVWWGARRPIDWYRPVWDVGPQPFPGDREWLDVVRHFQSGSRQPVWFLAHLSRPSLPMFDWRAVHRSHRYEFPRELQSLIGGARLDSVVWHSVRPPGWMLGRGWSLTPELAGTTAQDRDASRLGATEAFVRRRQGPQRLLIGGRYLGPASGPPVDLTVSIEAEPVAKWRVHSSPRWFFNWVDLPAGLSGGSSAYARLVVEARTPEGSDAGALIGLEQFDIAPEDDTMFALATGWHEAEANPSTGLSWRWTSAASSIEVRGGSRHRRLLLAGESPLRYFDRAPTVTVRAGDRVLGTFKPDEDFVHTIDLPPDAIMAASGRITIESDLTFSPSQDGSPDRRVLGLRLFSVTVR